LPFALSPRQGFSHERPRQSAGAKKYAIIFKAHASKRILLVSAFFSSLQGNGISTKWEK